jgi:hypothetical protein
MSGSRNRSKPAGLGRSQKGIDVVVVVVDLLALGEPHEEIDNIMTMACWYGVVEEAESLDSRYLLPHRRVGGGRRAVSLSLSLSLSWFMFMGGSLPHASDSKQRTG